MLFGGDLRRQAWSARCLTLVLLVTAASGASCLLPPLDLTGKSCVAQDDCGELACVDGRCAAPGLARDGGGPAGDASASHDGGVVDAGPGQRG